MAKKRQPSAWQTFDDAKLADLQILIGQVRSAKFRLELLRGAWNRMPDDEVEPLVDTLSEVADELEELFEELENHRDSEDEEG